MKISAKLVSERKHQTVDSKCKRIKNVSTVMKEIPSRGKWLHQANMFSDHFPLPPNSPTATHRGEKNERKWFDLTLGCNEKSEAHIFNEEVIRLLYEKYRR